MAHGKLQKHTMTVWAGINMKHLLIKRPRPHRPLPQLFLGVIGAVILGNIAFAQPASALNLGLKNENPSFFTPLNKNEQKLKELDKAIEVKVETFEEKQDIVEKAKQEASSVLNQKEQLAQQVASLKEELAQLDDMFVHIASYASNAAGNSYALGNCTWYAKSMRPDLPNFMGNANSWYSAAQAHGFKVGTKAKVGAIGTTSEGWAGHVVYIEKVSRDGSMVTISEMNYGGLYNMNTRTVPYTDFKYIYEKP